MNCVGVTCLTVVTSPVIIFQVPTSLLSDFASPFGSADQPVAAVTASAMISARHRVACGPPASTFALVAFVVAICFLPSFFVFGFGKNLSGQIKTDKKLLFSRRHLHDAT